MGFFSRLSYSFGNEDWKTEHRALKIKKGDRVLCITASGDRPLHTLLDNCQEVVSIDSNSVQNNLLNLKIAALKNLDYPNYLAFLGASPSNQRRELLKKVIPDLDTHSFTYWTKHQKAIDSGVIYQGSLEKLARFTSGFLHTARRSKVKKLFSFDNLKQQQDFVEQEWNTKLWCKTVDIWLSKPITKMLLNDPTLYVPSTGSLGAFVNERFNHCLNRHLATDCALLSLIFNGYVPKKAFPPYLTEQGFHEIKPRLDRITSHTSNVIDYLESAPAHSFDAFSLSDITSFLTIADFDRLIKGIYRTARPGARFSIRQVLSNHHIPKDYLPFFQRNYALEKQLQDEDRCFIYRYMVGEVVGI